jgi:hypothetical protein
VSACSRTMPWSKMGFTRVWDRSNYVVDWYERDEAP